MQIVSDSGMDISPEQMAGMTIHQVPLALSFEGESYRSGVDIQPEEFYRLLEQHPHSFPATSQPSVGDFATLYRQLAQTDPEILSIHISTGLSGTLNAARAGAEMVPEAKVTFWDTHTLSSPEGWQVEAAARAARCGWSMAQILALLPKVSAGVEGLFTLSTLKYLIHGGRISHLTGLVASVLAIKPIIVVDKETGKYANAHREVTYKRAIAKLVDVIVQKHPEGTAMRVQPLHGDEPEGVALLVEKLKERFDCTFLPTMRVTPALGAHTGPSLVGMAIAPLALFKGAPWETA
jgi:DegV family protein with EDD domain